MVGMIYVRMQKWLCTSAQGEIRRSFNHGLKNAGRHQVAAYIIIVVCSATTSLLYGYPTATIGLLGRRISLPRMAKRDGAEYEERPISFNLSKRGYEEANFRLSAAHFYSASIYALDCVIGCVPPFLTSITGWVGPAELKGLYARK